MANAKTKKANRKLIKKAALITSLSVLGIVLVLLITIIIFINQKLNLINKPGKMDYETVIPPDENDDPAQPDSEQSEIDKFVNQLQNNNTPIASSDNVTNILIVGIDARNHSDRARSDTMILVSINDKTKQIVMTSFLRDLYVNIPLPEDNKYYNRLNVAYYIKGGDLLCDTIEMNFKIKVDKYVTLNFFSFMDIIDAVGGIELDITEEEIPIINNYIKEINKLNGVSETDGYLTKSGKIKVNGKQALGYCRNRYIGSDFKRTERQRIVIGKMFEKAKGLNLFELNSLLNKFLPQVTTNLTNSELSYLLLNSPTYLSYELVNFRVPIDGSYQGLTINGASVVGVDLEKNITALHDKIFGKKD